jgi:predicted kinase
LLGINKGLGLLISGISICGYPSVGKTTLANELAPYIDTVVLSSDKVRKELNYKPSYTEEEKNLV